jgi:hypothetical protein
MPGTPFDRAIATCLPGYAGEADSTATVNDTAAHTLLTVPAAAVNAYYLVRVHRDAGGNETNVRIAAPGPATAKSQPQSSNEERVTLGPLQGGQTISYWGDVAGVTVSYARIS